jgi:C4-dicarboxylate-specific signal transduction histidine kinase
MTFLHSIVSEQMGWLVAAGIVCASLLALWVSTLLSRRWYVTLRRSEETELMSLYLSRIADALERLAAAREPLPQPHLDADATRPVGMSMLGR